MDRQSVPRFIGADERERLRHYVDAGKIAEGEASIEDVGREIFGFILDAASGRKQAWADRHGIRNDLAVFNPAPLT